MDSETVLEIPENIPKRFFHKESNKYKAFELIVELCIFLGFIYILLN